MAGTFNHEGLDVYRRALHFCAEMDTLIDGWDPRHAIRDHLVRAADSVIEQLARACAAPGHMKSRIMDYSLGSIMECGGCLDIARVKSLEAPEYLAEQKDEAVGLFRMLMGLDKSWEARSVQEASGEYKAHRRPRGRHDSFYHERLNVYQLPLSVMAWFVAHDPLETLSSRLYRKVDETLTSVILNVAEGNGRRSDADKKRFMKTSYDASIKAASLLDLCAIKGAFKAVDVDQIKQTLVRVTAMTASMAGITLD
jgi:four helix bundle protein